MANMLTITSSIINHICAEQWE